MIAKHNSRYIQERIYGTITLLATNLGLLSQIEHLNAKQVAMTIFTTAIGLWLASVFAEILAHKITQKHQKNFSEKISLKNSLGILQSAGFSFIMSFLAIFQIIPLRSALLSAIILAFLQIFAIIIFISYQKETNFWWNL